MGAFVFRSSILISKPGVRLQAGKDGAHSWEAAGAEGETSAPADEPVRSSPVVPLSNKAFNLVTL